MAGHVFLAYARHDREYAERLAAFLRTMRVDIWSDEEIGLGTNWARHIQNQLDTASAVVVVVTPAASESEWVSREVEYALQRRKPIFPVLLAGPPLFPLVNVQHEDVSGGRLPGQAFVETLSATTRSAVAPPTGDGATLVNRDATKVFLSYRRSDAAFAAHWLHRELAEWFRRDSDLAEDSFFIDVDSIDPGRRFKAAVEAAIIQCQVLLAIIGDRWLTVERNGIRRLDAAHDLVRQEIELGLKHGVTLVPVLVFPAIMPDSELLPESIREMTEFQGMTVYPERFRDNADYLAGKLKQIIMD